MIGFDSKIEDVDALGSDPDEDVEFPEPVPVSVETTEPSLYLVGFGVAPNVRAGVVGAGLVGLDVGFADGVLEGKEVGCADGSVVGEIDG